MAVLRRVPVPVLAAVLTVGVAACGGGEPPGASAAGGGADSAAGGAATSVALPGGPVTFRGTIPCADCPGIELTVTLLPDGTFRLRQRYLDRDPGTTWLDLGRWTEEGGRLDLRGSGERPAHFRRFAWDSIRILDGEGREIPSGLPYGLPRAAEVDPVEDVQLLQGMMTYMADAAVFAECRTGAAFPIAQEGAYLALERAYLAERPAPGGPLLVRVRGSLALRPGMEGGETTSLVVDAFEGTEPGAGCGEAVADLPLEGTEWVLVELAGAPLPDGAEATLLLDGSEWQASGRGGCNRFSGPYRLEGGSLTFGNMAATRMACTGPAMEVEDAYLRILARIGGYRVMGADLQLLAEEGVVARFRSR
jgi:copper homeostasis protein (lipoprotein)